MMKKRSAIAAMVLGAVLAVSNAAPVLAGGTYSVSNASVDVGKSVTVQASVDGNKATLRFDPAYFTVTGGTDGYSVSGDTVTFSGSSGSVTFEAKQSGTTWFELREDGTAVGSSRYTVNAGSGTDTSTDTSSSSSTGSTTDTSSGTSTDTSSGTSASTSTDTSTSTSTSTSSTTTASTSGSNYTADFEVDGVGYVLSTRFTTDEIPSGYTEVRNTLHRIENLRYLRGENPDILVYLKALDAEGNLADQGSFWRYDSSSDTVSPLNMIGDTDNYYMVLTPPEMPAATLVDATVEANGNAVPVYTIPGQEGAYYFYGHASTGGETWFALLPEYNLVIAADEEVLNTPTEAVEPAEDVQPIDSSTLPAEEDTESTEEEPEGLFARIVNRVKGMDPRFLWIGLIVLVALIIILIVNLVLRAREREMFEDDEEDDIDYDYDYGKIRLNHDKETAAYRARVSRYDEDDEDYYQDGLSKYLQDTDDEEPAAEEEPLPEEWEEETEDDTWGASQDQWEEETETDYDADADEDWDEEDPDGYDDEGWDEDPGTESPSDDTGWEGGLHRAGVQGSVATVMAEEEVLDAAMDGITGDVAKTVETIRTQEDPVPETVSAPTRVMPNPTEEDLFAEDSQDLLQRLAEEQMQEEEAPEEDAMGWAGQDVFAAAQEAETAEAADAAEEVVTELPEWEEPEPVSQMPEHEALDLTADALAAEESVDEIPGGEAAGFEASEPYGDEAPEASDVEVPEADAFDGEASEADEALSEPEETEEERELRIAQEEAAIAAAKARREAERFAAEGVPEFTLIDFNDL